VDKDVMIEIMFLTTDVHQSVKFKFSGLVMANHQFVNTMAHQFAVMVELKMDNSVMMETQ
jgi:hypothetical protein